MKGSPRGSTILAHVLSVILFSLIIFQPVSMGHALPSPQAQVLTFDIGSKVYQPWSMATDGSYIYVVDVKGTLSRVNPTTLPSQGVNDITTINIFPTSGPWGNFVGSVSIVIRNGVAWVEGMYNSGQALSRISLNDLSVQTFFPPNNIGAQVGLAADNTFVYIAGSGIARFNQTDHTWSTIAPGSLTQDLLLNGTTIWFTRQAGGLGKVSTDGTNLTYYKSGFSGTTIFLANATDGRLWFTENSVHKIGVFNPVDSSVTEYDYGGYFSGSGDGPFGLVFDPKGELWVAGGDQNNLREFDPSSATWNLSGDVGLWGRAYYLLLYHGRVWGDATGAPPLLFEVFSDPVPTTNFSISSSTTSINLVQHTATGITISVMSAANFSGTVRFSLYYVAPLNVSITPTLVSLKPAQIATAILTVGSDASNGGPFLITLTGFDANGIIVHHIVISVRVGPPNGMLGYSLFYLGSPPSPGSNVTLVNNFTNTGNLPDRVTSGSIQSDFGTFSLNLSLPLNIPAGAEKMINLTIIVPLGTAIGNHTVTANISWSAFYLGQWNAGSPIAGTGTLRVAAPMQRPPSSPTSKPLPSALLQMLNWARKYGLPILVLYAIGISVLAVLVVKREQRRSPTSLEKTPPGYSFLHS